MSIYEGLKDAASILKEAGKIEQYKQILETQVQLHDMQEENQKLKGENKRLQELLELKDQLVHRSNMYFLGNDTQKPFCSRCWDSDKKLIHLTLHENGAIDCPVKDCKLLVKRGQAHVYVSNYSKNSAR